MYLLIRMPFWRHLLFQKNIVLHIYYEIYMWYNHLQYII